MELLDIAKSFQIEGEIKSIGKYGNGHINSTFLIQTDKKDYILQKINTYAFKNPEVLMNNIYLVTEYIRSIGQESMRIIKTKQNEIFLKIDNDNCYRVYDFVKDTICYEEIETLAQIELDAKAFGKLHKDLKGLDATKLGEVILNFHNTPIRYQNLLNAISLNPKNRLDLCKKEILIVDKYKDKLSYIVDGIKDGSIHLTTTHNDPKINNVLFDAVTKEVRCVIDLDTIMPGSVLFDVGDAFRSLFTGKNENSDDLSKLKVNFDIYESYLKGYALEMKGVLTPREIELLPYSAFLLTIECGIRFLEDYLRGDVYFHINHEDDNLRRCRTQLALAEDIYNNLDKLQEITKKYF